MSMHELGGSLFNLFALFVIFFSNKLHFEYDGQSDSYLQAITIKK